MILASGSPRRRELLAAAGYDFAVISPAVSEVQFAYFSLREITLANAFRKGRAVSRLHPAGVVLAADTLVALDGEVIGKPRDLEHAQEILRALSGRTHEVCSAVFVGCETLARERLFHVVSRVRFRALTDAAIAEYFAKIDPLDKAGAYAAQDDAGKVIAEIDGSFTNVVGLPMEETAAVLREFAVEPRRD